MTNEPNTAAIEAAITELQNENYDLGASDQYNSGLAIGIQTGYQKGYEAAKCTWGKYWADGDVYISACEPDRDFLMDADAQFPTYCGNCGGKISPTWKGE